MASGFSRERAMAVERHLRRVAERLPSSPEGLQPSTDPYDAVILHVISRRFGILLRRAATDVRRSVGQTWVSPEGGSSVPQGVTRA